MRRNTTEADATPIDARGQHLLYRPKLLGQGRLKVETELDLGKSSHKDFPVVSVPEQKNSGILDAPSQATNWTAADVELGTEPEPAVREALKLLGREVRDYESPLPNRRRADRKRPRDIRGRLVVIENIGFEHKGNLTQVPKDAQPQFRRSHLTLVYMNALNTREERLRSAMEVAGLRGKDLAKACGVSHAAVTKWLKGGKMNADNIECVCTRLAIERQWLMNGKGRRETGSAPDQRAVAHAVEKLQHLEEPLLAFLEAIRDLSPQGRSRKGG